MRSSVLGRRIRPLHRVRRHRGRTIKIGAPGGGVCGCPGIGIGIGCCLGFGGAGVTWPVGALTPSRCGSTGHAHVAHVAGVRVVEAAGVIVADVAGVVVAGDGVFDVAVFHRAGPVIASGVVGVLAVPPILGTVRALGILGVPAVLGVLGAVRTLGVLGVFGVVVVGGGVFGVVGWGVGGEGFGVDQDQEFGDDFLLHQRDERIRLAHPQRPVIALRTRLGIRIQQRPQPRRRLTRQIKLPLQTPARSGADPQKPPPVI
ncbi:hypothetical protein AB0C08_39230, partial [Microbispora bryophytorum]|uniref:hypothetical protein n=1 Tax=Microbispora bryophytorum TaxID=1460882 RepID=UPI0033CE4FC9